MTTKFLSMKNLKSTLNATVKAAKNTYPRILSDHPPKTMDMILDAAFDFAQKELYPIFEDMDRHPPRFEDGQVMVHPKVKSILTTLGKDGWISAAFPPKWGGENMPAVLLHAINFILSAANYSASVYSGLTMGAARLILTYGSSQLQEIYLPPMLAGKWQGTMALTEPEAGTSLGDLTTMAIPAEDGLYNIIGEKIFISAGDHDNADNIVHLLLARIEGAPKGPKGISLFVVPKLRPDSNGNLVQNDITVTQIFHKMGYRGAPIAGLTFGEKKDCIGYLVGEPHKGLAYMFQMMNGARLEVGMGATAIATAAYHAALEYCKTRKQGRRITDKKDADPVAIIEHPDIKRMLLFQRAITEGSLALVLQCGIYEDIVNQDPKNHDVHTLLELLTPIAKTFPSEMGILSTSQSIQCFGGYGYCEDFPVEQHFRDMRIHPIHEGTTGIQAMDLLGRKVVMNNGRALVLFVDQVKQDIEKAGNEGQLAKMGEALSIALNTLTSTTQMLGAVAFEQGPEAYMADATLYLEMFGIVTIAWQWLSMAQEAITALKASSLKASDKLFFEGKLFVGQYFFSHELPKVNALSMTLMNKNKISLEMGVEHFTN